jgi:glycosyltransferase involved in cell wall biosynthesis
LRGCAALTIHDAVQAALLEEFPFWDRYGLLYRWSVRRAQVVLADSAATATDIQQYYGVPRARIRVVPLGADPVFQPVDPQPVLRRLGLDDRPYLLFVGKLTRRRNIPGSCAAFAAAAEKEYCLVLAGENSAQLDLVAIARRLGLGDRFRYLPFPPDEELVALYSGATLVVYPSQREGFGLPIVEAMACGAPVLTVATSAMQEVAGEAAWYASSPAASDLVAPLRAALADPERGAALAAAGRERAAHFRWESPAASTLAALSELICPGTVHA